MALYSDDEGHDIFRPCNALLSFAGVKYAWIKLEMAVKSRSFMFPSYVFNSLISNIINGSYFG